mgnify:CR=1 FL=1
MLPFSISLIIVDYDRRFLYNLIQTGAAIDPEITDRRFTGSTGVAAFIWVSIFIFILRPTPVEQLDRCFIRVNYTLLEQRFAHRCN